MIEVSDRVEFHSPGPRARLTRGVVVGYVRGLRLRVRDDAGAYFSVEPDFARKLAPAELKAELAARSIK